jgi:hypothetical protein
MLLGGATVSTPMLWPLAARAQQQPMPVIGFLHSASADTFRAQLDAFRQGLRDDGYVEGENVAMECKSLAINSLHIHHDPFAHPADSHACEPSGKSTKGLIR